MKVAILTSSRADFGIYYPLLKKLKSDSYFDLEIIVFGTHLKNEFGYTIKEIQSLGFLVKHKIMTQVKNDTPKDISMSIGDAILSFSDFWSKFHFNLVFALGDRYEMFAAVSAASPFNIDIAHIHAGETTLGAIDNTYRHSISLMSKYLFVTTEEYKERAESIVENSKNIFNVGALSIDNLMNQEFYTKEEFYNLFSIDLNIPSILTTFHPETVNYHKNEEYIIELLSALNILKEEFQIIITLPNSDTMGNMIRNKINDFSKNKNNIKVIESFGMKGYLSCMKECAFLLGNTSSGFVEAAFFPKWVINIGNRQGGRVITENIISSPINQNSILTAVKSIRNKNITKNVNIYGNGAASSNIISILKTL